MLTRVQLREIVETQSTLCLHLIPWNPILNLPLNRVGTYILPLTPRPRETKPKLIYEVSFVEGSKIITVRSNVLVKNATTVPIEVYLERDGHQPFIMEPIGTNKEVLTLVAAGSSQSLPVEFASTAILKFRPAFSGSHYRWSLQEHHLQQLQSSIGQRIIQCTSLYPTDSYFFLVDIKGDKEGFERYSYTPPAACTYHTYSDQYIISLFPPSVIENLLCCELDFKVLDKSTSERVQAQGIIESGSECPLHKVDFCSASVPATVKVTIAGYEWSTAVVIEPFSEPKSLQLLDDKRRPLILYASMT